MMKLSPIFFISLLQCTLLLSHGFSTDTLVLLADNTSQKISSLCYRAQKKKLSVTSYNTVACFQTTAPIVRGGHGKTNCYIRFGFEERFSHSQHHNEVACTPTQEFYSASTYQWIPAYKLKTGDELFCADNKTKIVAYVSLIKEPLQVCTIQVKYTHAFFVTEHALLTHNMVLPMAFSLGFSIPIGAISGGAAGSFFGPPTFIFGVVIGCVAGVLAKLVCGSKVATYTLDAYDINTFAQYANQQPIATIYEPPITVNQSYTTNTNTFDTNILQTCTAGFSDPENTLLFNTTIENQPKEKPGCGDTTPQEPFICITPAELMLTFQNQGYRPLSDEEREMLFGNGCTFIPIPESEKESTNICGGITPISVAISNILKIATPNDTDNKRYDGPTYNRTEDWIDNHPIPDAAKHVFERTNLGMQGKRAYRLKKKISEFTGISQGEYVVIDALHKDHLEVYNKHGKWSHVIDFNGTKNECKTQQASKNKSRQDLTNL